MARLRDPEPEDMEGYGGSEFRDEAWYVNKLTSSEKALFEEIASEFNMGAEQRLNTLRYKFGDIELYQERGFWSGLKSFAQFLWDTIKTVAKNDIVTWGVRWFQNASNNPHLCFAGEMVLTGYDIMSLISPKRWVNAAAKLIEFAWKGEVGLVNVPDVHKCYEVGKEIVGILREKFYFSRKNLFKKLIGIDLPF